MDLSLVPADELVKELDKRFESCAFLSHKYHKDGDAFDWHFHGNRMTICGLLDLAKSKIKEDFLTDETGGFTKD